MKRLLGKFFFFLIGWKISANITPEVKHSVMIAAPHTSNWDFPFAIAAFWIMGIEMRYFIKDAYTRPLLFGWLFRWTGAMGVSRSQRNNLVEHSIELLKTRKELVILVPAEGTRKWVDKWKTGFYHIAIGAGVPITLGYLDYKSKTAGVDHSFMPSGNFEQDMQYIENFYKDKTGRYPELYNPEIF
jgi:1-acyl-sn-glycerol-3-phosphate acyltransferase